MKVNNNGILQRCAALATVVLSVGCLLAGASSAQASQGRTEDPSSVHLPNKADHRHFMVYYRAWRDKTMKGVNTDLPDDNWITMHDIPYGIDVVNVFSYVPKGQEEKAKPFYDALKKEYAPDLHRRGIRLVKGLGYDTLLDVPHKGDTPTQAEYDAYADLLISEHVVAQGLDGLDIDMEQFPSEKDVKLSDGVILALSKRLGPQSGTNKLFIYDTNGSNLNPFKNVKSCFDFLAYQQYGTGSDRTQRAVQDYAGLLSANSFVPGLTFPEEQDHNRWIDAVEPYADSHIHDVASYSREHGLGGMFLYALDRDGRTYEPDDLKSIKPSNLLWTKTAIAENQAMNLVTAKALANHYLERMKYMKEPTQSVREAVASAGDLYEVNKAILGPDYASAYNPTFDPTLEKQLTSIDILPVMADIDEAQTIIQQFAGRGSSQMEALEHARSQAVRGIGGKLYSGQDVQGWQSGLESVIQTFKPSDVQPGSNPDSAQDSELSQTGTVSSPAFGASILAISLALAIIVVRRLHGLRLRHTLE